MSAGGFRALLSQTKLKHELIKHQYNQYSFNYFCESLVPMNADSCISIRQCLVSDKNWRIKTWNFWSTGGKHGNLYKCIGGDAD